MESSDQADQDSERDAEWDSEACEVSSDAKAKQEAKFLRPLFSHYKEVRVQMQLISVVISIVVSGTEVAVKGYVTPAALSVLSGIPLCIWLATLLQKHEKITQAFLEVFDTCVILAALIFDACACYALSQSNSAMFATCVAYLTVAYVLPQVSQRWHARVFTIAHCAMVWFLFGFDVEKYMPLIINCLLLDVGNDRLARSLGIVAQRQMVANTELFLTSQGFIRSMLSGFCDAFVVMESHWTLAEDSQSLAALLGRPALKGKKFDSFIDPGDLADFQQYMESSINSMVNPDVELPQIANFRSVQLHSVKIHLHDAYHQPVAVHICSASLQTMEGQPLHLVGISEMWVPLATARKPKSHHKMRPPLSYNMSTGKLESSVQLLKRTDSINVKYGTSSLDVLSTDQGTARRRRDSPAPKPAGRHRAEDTSGDPIGTGRTTRISRRLGPPTVLLDTV